MGGSLKDSIRRNAGRGSSGDDDDDDSDPPPTHQGETFPGPPELVNPLFSSAQRLARAVEDGLGAEGTFVAMNNRISQSVPHLHLHIVPRRKRDGLRGFFWPRTKYASELELHASRDAVIAALARRECA